MSCKNMRTESFEQWAGRVLKDKDRLIVEDLKLAPYLLFQLRRERLNDDGSFVAWTFMPKRKNPKKKQKGEHRC